jgi:alkylation response protein AidB-like acyl-CoA dehydrogenase
VSTPADIRQELVETIRRFVEREVVPVASTLEHKNEYPHRLAERMNELGLFGATIPSEFGGLGLDFTTYAMIIEELCVGWMSLSGILNTHLLLGYIIASTARRRKATCRSWLAEFMAPRPPKPMPAATGAPHHGAPRRHVRRQRHQDVVTNGREGKSTALVCKNDPRPTCRTRG